MIKKILIALVAIVVLLVAVVAVVSFVTPTDFRVERETTINKPSAEVFSYAKILKNQNEWGPWHKKDPQMQQEFRGTDGQPGFVSAWKGNSDTGEGEQEIKRIVENERIETELRFKEPFESRADAWFTTDALGENQTKVKWGFSSSMPRPLNVMLAVMDMDKMAGKDFEEGLASLKSIMEKR
ncbi:MAG: SRPBCC family protein [Pyrinomonadaceae bacterium]